MRNKVFPRILLCVLLCISSFSIAFAQQKTVTGIISDQNGAPLSNATVRVKGEKMTATTDANGAFKIAVPPNTKTLVVSYVGMDAQEISIEGKTTVLATLNVADTRLNEVVVIGYGTAKRANVTSSISSVTERDLKNIPVAGADQAIQGKVAGVTVSSNGGQPGGGVSVRVRGITSVNGNDPLYVIDGVPMGGTISSLDQNVLGGGSGQTGQSVLASLNPSDIASIDILKDASAQAIYGSRAANGVVLINTKRGKAGEGKIAYDTYFGWQSIPKKLPIMNLQEYGGYLNSLVNEVRAAGDGMDSTGEFKNPALLGEGTDWQDAIFRTGLIQNHQLSFSGGQGKTNYYFSGNYYNQTGIIIGSEFNRYSIRFNLDQQVKTWLRAGVSANLSRSNQKIALTDGFDAVTGVVLYNSPAAPIKTFDGNYATTTSIGGITFGNPRNPVALAEMRDVRTVQSKAFGSLYADLTILKGLTFRNEVNYDFNLSSSKAYQPFVQNDQSKEIILSPSHLREERGNSYYWAVKSYLTYNNSFGKHAVNATAGHEAQYSRWDNIQAYRTNLTLNLPSLAAGAGGNGSGEQIGAGAGEWSMESYFARLNYTYDEKYALSASVRRDASSAFGENNRVGYFPAASVSWTASNEAFMQNIKWLNYLKLRVGAGAVGNQNVAANSYTTNIRLITEGPFGPGGIPRNVGNPDLGWESVITYNAGVDATLFNRRVDLSVDVYKKVTTDMLLATQLGDFSGLGEQTNSGNWNDIWTPIANDGEMTNTGIDVSLTTYNVQTKDLTWKTTVTFSHYKNVLNRLNTPDAAISGRVRTDYSGNEPVVTLTKQGLPVGAFYGYVTNGLFRSMDQLNNGTNWGLPVGMKTYWLGDVLFKDLDGNKAIDDKDVEFIGNPNPKFTFGFNNTVNYKNFDLGVFLYGSVGAKIFNIVRRQTEGLTNPYNNQSKDVLNRYTATNTNGNLPRFNQWHNNNFRISDRFVEDGSFLRIQTLTLGYNLPKNLIGKAKLTSARLYVSAQNIYTFTGYSGYDPDLGSLNNNVTRMNIDDGHYPNPRTITVGANIEF